jgi:hypothetical protein
MGTLGAIVVVVIIALAAWFAFAFRKCAADPAACVLSTSGNIVGSVARIGTSITAATGSVVQKLIPGPIGTVAGTVISGPGQVLNKGLDAIGI